MCPTNAATKCASCYPNFLLSSTGNSCDPFDSSALETLTLDRNTLQTGLDSCSMMVFGFGFFVYVISITLAMFCVVANYIVRSRKKTSISSSQENGVSVKIAPAVVVAEKHSSQARLMERLGTIPEADKRANRRRSRLSIGGDESGVHL